MKSAQAGHRWKDALPSLISGLVIAAAGVFFGVRTAGGALADNPANGATLTFALCLIAALMGCVLVCLGLGRLRHPAQHVQVHTLALAALFAALCYIGFTFFKIDIPVGSEKTAFHLGNVFCVLAALLLGGFWGGMAGAVGMTIADLTTAYVTSAPKTFLLKLGIGLIVGFVARRCFHLDRQTNPRKIAVATVVSSAAGMGFNVIADPLVGYFYKRYILGVPQEAAEIWAKIGAVTTLVNAVIAVAAASVFYLALRPALSKAGLMHNRIS